MTQLYRAIIIPENNRAKSKLVIIDPHNQEYIAFDVVKIRLLADNNVLFHLRGGFTAVIPVASIYDTKNHVTNNILYVVLTKTPVKVGKYKTLDFQPYDRSLIDALSDIGDKTLFDKMIEEIEKYKKIAETSRIDMFVRLSADGLDQIELVTEMTELMKQIIDSLIKNQTDEAKSYMSDKLSSMIRSIIPRYEKIISEIKNMKDRLVHILLQFGYSREELEKMNTRQLIHLIQDEIYKLAKEKREVLAIAQAPA